MPAEFYRKTYKNKTRDYVRVWHPNDATVKADRPATEADKLRFPNAWDAYQNPPQPKKAATQRRRRADRKAANSRKAA